MDAKYVVKLTQSGSSAPVATEIRNDLGGTPVWARSSAGVYTCTLSGVWSPVARVVVDYSPTFTVVVTSTSILTVTVAGGDGTLSDTLFDVTVYAEESTSTHYCSQTDVERRISTLTLAQLTSDTANSTTPNATIVDAILGRVDALIDARVGQVYTVPFTTVPDIIKRLAVDLACYEVFQRRPINMAMPRDWQTAYENAMKELEAISNQERLLPTTATVASQEADIDVSYAIDKIDFTDNDIDNPMQTF